MKKGKIVLCFAGILDLLLGLGVITFGVFTMLDLLDIAETLPMFDEFYEGFVYFASNILNLSYSSSIYYIYAGIILFFGLCSLISSLAILVKIGRGEKQYYRCGGGQIASIVLETFGLAFFGAHIVPYVMEKVALAEYFILLGVTSAYVLIIVLRIVGICRFYRGKKALENPK